MAARKRPRPWDATLDRIRVKYQPQYNYPPRTRAVELDAAEQTFNFSFPDSYREFAQEFGLGGWLLCSLPHLLPLNPPPGVGVGDWFRSVLGATNSYHADDWGIQSDQVRMLRRRAIVFAMDGSYAHWMFDPSEVTNPDTHEYRIYELDKVDTLTVVGDTFEDWLRYIDQRYRFPDEEEYEDDDQDYPPIYLPSAPEEDSIIYDREKFDFNQKCEPEESQVTSWLTWNDNTARTLAETTRHQSRPDLFPILADALEDAGCTSADVLRSCRTGEPAVDGVWVLQVLLGKPATS